MTYGRSRYYFHEGVWYRPYGRGFVVVAPPFGLIVPFLPLYYTTLWVGGIPYYYANEIYYTQTAGGYMVVEPPKGEAAQAPPATTGQIVHLSPQRPERTATGKRSLRVPQLGCGPDTL